MIIGWKVTVRHFYIPLHLQPGYVKRVTKDGPPGKAFQSKSIALPMTIKMQVNEAMIGGGQLSPQLSWLSLETRSMYALYNILAPFRVKLFKNGNCSSQSKRVICHRDLFSLLLPKRLQVPIRVTPHRAPLSSHGYNTARFAEHTPCVCCVSNPTSKCDSTRFKESNLSVTFAERE